MMNLLPIIFDQKYQKFELYVGVKNKNLLCKEKLEQQNHNISIKDININIFDNCYINWNFSVQDFSTYAQNNLYKSLYCTQVGSSIFGIFFKNVNCTKWLSFKKIVN